jgi:hypothetical protein
MSGCVLMCASICAAQRLQTQCREIGPGQLQIPSVSEIQSDSAVRDELLEWRPDSVLPYVPHRFTGVAGPPTRNRYADRRFNSPLACFELYFDAEVVDYLVEQTNEVGSDKFGVAWVDVSTEAMKAVIGTVIRMGFMQARTLPDYWSQERGWAPVYSVWARDPFLRIWWSLNAAADVAEDDRKADRLADVRPLADLLNRKYAAALRPPVNLAVDESMISFRGKHPSFQMMPKKPIRRGFKLWTMSDVSGYVYKQDLYVGKTAERPEDGVMSAAVKELVRPYFGKYHVIYMNSAFTSLKLVQQLLAEKTLVVGKLHPKRGSFPAHVRNAVLQTDQSVSCQSTTHPEISATATRDNKRRHELLSSATPLPMEIVEYTPARSPRSFPAPLVIRQYNSESGGVDRSNRSAAYTLKHRKTMRAHMTFIEHFIAVAASNAWVLRQHFGPPPSDSDPPITDYKEFLWQLSTELIGDFVGRSHSGGQTVGSIDGHVHQKAARQPNGRRPNGRCSVCCTRAGGVETGHRTVWQCSCSRWVCHTETSCFAAHLDAVRAGTAESRRPD